MKKLTSTLILAFAVIFSSPSVMATSLDNQDMAFAFGSEGITSEMLALSEREMVETEGAAVPAFLAAGWSVLRAGGSRLVSWGRSLFAPTPKNTAYGAAAGSISYGASNIPNGTWTLRGQLGATAGGATGGIFRSGGMSGLFGAGVGGYTGGFISSPPSQNNSMNFGRDVGSYCGMCRNYPR